MPSGRLYSFGAQFVPNKNVVYRCVGKQCFQPPTTTTSPSSAKHLYLGPSLHMQSIALNHWIR